MDNAVLAKLMAKKKDVEPMGDDEKNARVSMLQALKAEMQKMMAGDLPGVKKVEVAAPDQAGLAMGLDKAKGMLDKGSPDADPMAQDDDADEDSDSDSPSGGELIEDQIKHEGGEGELSPEEIDTLMALLSKLKASKAGV